MASARATEQYVQKVDVQSEGGIMRRLWTLAVLALVGPPGVSAQTCAMPEALRSTVPAERPDVPYARQRVTGPDGAAVALGVGHLHVEDRDPGLPPGAFDWVSRVELPISSTPGTPPARWLAGGWIVGGGDDPRPLGRGELVETGYEELSFIVLEDRSDGWLRIRYGPGLGGDGTGWTPTCALGEGPATLTFSTWSDWWATRAANASPLFFRTPTPGPVFRRPSLSGERLEDIGDDYILYPLEVQGDWMRVRVAEPSDYCEVDAEPVTREGWIRWNAPESGPVVWYFTRGC